MGITPNQSSGHITFTILDNTTMKLGRIITVLCFTILSTSWCVSQTGFYETYKYRDTALWTEFFSILNDNDTLVVHGLSVDENGDQGLLITFLDTLGNILEQKFHADSILLPPFTAEENYDIVKTPDGGYAVVGESEFVSVLIKLNKRGDIEWLHRYPVGPEATVSLFHRLISLPDGYLMAGFKQWKSDFKIYLYVTRLDIAGDTLWERSYGDIGIYHQMGNVVSVDNNTFIIGAWKTKDLVQGVFWTQPWFFCIDSLGEVKWEWFGVRDIKAGIVDDFVLTLDGGIVFLNTFVDSVVNIGTDIGFTRARIVKLNANRMEVWSTVLGLPTTIVNGLSDLAITTEGDFIATGKYAPIEVGGSGTALVNWTAKVSSEGDVTWERFDSTIWTPDKGVLNDPSGITLLSSGSIVICGTVERIHGPDSGDRGYIIKLDKNGCMEEGCELGPITRVDVPYDQNLEVLIYPNPASESATVEFSGRGSIILFDIQGRLMQSIIDATDQATLDLSLLLPGTYFVRVVTDAGWTVRKIIKG